MTEAFDPNALVGAQDLLAVRPDTVIQRHPNKTGAVAFVGLARRIMSPGTEKIPLGTLHDDPTNQWGLTLIEEGLANHAAKSYAAENRFTAVAEALAADAFPEDSARQTVAVHSATSILHHAARSTVLLPRRQVYQEFANRRRYWLESLGDMAVSQLLQGDDPQVELSTHKRIEKAIRNIQPTAQLPDFSALEPAAAMPILQEIIGDAAVLSRLLLRHAPEYLVNREIWPDGPAGLAQCVLQQNPWNLWQALVSAPHVPARDLIGAYTKTRYLSSEMMRHSGGRQFYPEEQLRSDRRHTAAIQAELDKLLEHDNVNAELLTATVGDVVQLAPRDVVMSKASFGRILNENLHALGLSQYLNSIGQWEEQRTGMPDFSDTWQNTKNDPANKVLADFYGNVRNPRIVVLPIDETLALTKYKYATRIDFSRAMRLAVLVDLRSSVSRSYSKPITRVLEVTIYPNRSVHRDIITRDVRSHKIGAQAVLNLWRESAMRAYELEGIMIRGAFHAGPPGSGKRGGSRG